MYIHFAKNQTKKQGIYFRHISSTQQNTFACSFSSKKNGILIFSLMRKRSQENGPFFWNMCVIQNFSGRRGKESDLNFIETWTKETVFWRPLRRLLCFDSKGTRRAENFQKKTCVFFFSFNPKFILFSEGLGGVSEIFDAYF